MSTLGERIKYARETKGFLQSDLAKLIGVKSSGVISNWEKNLNKPDAEKIVKLCDVLDISASFLLNYYGKEAFEVNPHEQEHIKKYRDLDLFGRQTVDIVLDRESTRVKEFNNMKEHIEELESSQATVIDIQPRLENNTRFIECHHSASARTGVFILGNETVDQLPIPDTPENRKVDYAIKVSGNSMEPDYIDGDIVFVSQKAELNHGDVGIFIINNNAHIKEYGYTELISRNPNADNIIISEYDNIVCMGKVVGKYEE